MSINKTNSYYQMPRNGFLFFSFIFSFIFANIIPVLGQTQTIKINGVNCTYIVHAPSGLINPPLLLNMHGQGGTAAGQQSVTKFDAIADREKFIVVYPNAPANQSWVYSGATEFAFLLAIVDTMKAKYNIDKNRIYSSGFSQGGVMSYNLACRYANTFAAIAPTSQYIMDSVCKPSRPVPMRLVFGTKDFDKTTSHFLEAAAKWLKIDSCPTVPVVTRPYPSNHPNSLVTRLVYGPCAQGTEVMVDTIVSGTHQWQMDTSTMINNSEETWAFLKRFSLSGKTTSSQKKISDSRNPTMTISASYSLGAVHLRGIGENSNGENGILEKGIARVYDTRGILVLTSVINQGQFFFKSESRDVYTVMISSKESYFTARIVVP